MSEASNLHSAKAGGEDSAPPRKKRVNHNRLLEPSAPCLSTELRGTVVAQILRMNIESIASSTPIHDRFLADHRRLENLLERILNAFEGDDRDAIQKLWTEFERKLLSHLETEEKFLVPNLLRTREREARTILAEHKHIRTRLAELGEGIDLHIVRLNTIRTFVDELRAHAQHEDMFLYAWSDTNLEESERTSIMGALL